MKFGRVAQVALVLQGVLLAMKVPPTITAAGLAPGVSLAVSGVACATVLGLFACAWGFRSANPSGGWCLGAVGTSVFALLPLALTRYPEWSWLTGPVGRAGVLLIVVAAPLVVGAISILLGARARLHQGG